MDRRKLVFWSIIIVLVAAVIGLIYNMFRPPDYIEMLYRIEALMRQQDNVSINYRVSYESTVTGETLTGQASFKLDGDDIYWNNTIGDVEGSFYDLKPYELTDFMSYAIEYTVEVYDNRTPCFLLNALVSVDTDYNLFLAQYHYSRVLACFDKVTGYPLQYTLLVVGENDGFLVSYNSLSPIVKRPINESAIPEPIDPAVLNDPVVQEALRRFHNISGS